MGCVSREEKRAVGSRLRVERVGYWDEGGGLTTLTSVRRKARSWDTDDRRVEGRVRKENNSWSHRLSG